jgi:hypothetical protein
MLAFPFACHGRHSDAVAYRLWASDSGADAFVSKGMIVSTRFRRSALITRDVRHAPACAAAH